MIIKMDRFELELVKDREVYLGSAHGGQLFKNWEDLDESARYNLSVIQEKAERLIKEAESVLKPLAGAHPATV